MDLKRLRKPDLLLVCEELGRDANEGVRKPAIQRAITDSGNDNKSIAIAWELGQETQEEHDQK